MTPSPPPCRQEPLQVLPRRDQQPLDVDVLQASPPEATQAMPELSLGKQRLHPDLALAHRFLVGLGGVITTDSFQVVGIEGAMDDAAAIACCAFGLEWTAVARRGIGPV